MDKHVLPTVRVPTCCLPFDNVHHGLGKSPNQQRAQLGHRHRLLHIHAFNVSTSQRDTHGPQSLLSALTAGETDHGRRSLGGQIENTESQDLPEETLLPDALTRMATEPSLGRLFLAHYADGLLTANAEKMAALFHPGLTYIVRPASCRCGQPLGPQTPHSSPSPGLLHIAHHPTWRHAQRPLLVAIP